MDFTSPATIALASIGAILIGMAKGGLPSIGMLAVPLLALQISPVRAAALLLPIYVLTDIVAVWIYRRNFSRVNLRILIPPAIGGVLIGWATATILSDNAVRLFIGLLGIGFCLNVWLRKRAAGMDGTPARVVPGLFWGTLSGFTSFIAHAGAPPFQIYVLPQRLPKLVFAGTSTILFAVINAAKILPYAELQPYTSADAKIAALLLMPAFAGTAIGAKVTGKLPDRWFFAFVQSTLFIVSLKLTWDAIRSLHVGT
jgi:uncharacterized membrane protein YfcA